MKIVRIIARFNVGGPARHVTWLNAELQDAEFRSVLITGTVPAGEEDMSYLADASGIKPIYIDEMSREISAKDIVVLWKLFRVLKREEPDIIHTHTAKAGTVGRIAAYAYNMSRKLSGKKRSKVVHTFHGHVFHSYYGRSKTAIFLQIERALARFATDKIITISDQQQKEILEDFRIGTRRQFAVIPLGIDLGSVVPTAGDRERIRAEIGASVDEIVVGFIGRLTDIKNIPMLLDVAVRYASATFSRRIRFVIVGDGHLRTEIEDFVETNGLREIVHFLGNRTDVAAVYAGLDIVALTSLNEGTPLSLIEGMAAGRPFVSTAVGGVIDLRGGYAENRDSFEIWKNGITVRSGDVTGFLNGLRFLAENERMRQNMGADGRKFVEKTYAKSRLVNDIKTLYRGLSHLPPPE